MDDIFGYEHHNNNHFHSPLHCYWIWCMTKSGFKIVQLSKDWYATTRAAKMETGETVSKGKQKGGISSKLRRGKGTLVKSNLLSICCVQIHRYDIIYVYNIFKNNEHLLKSPYGVDVPIPNHLATWDHHGTHWSIVKAWWCQLATWLVLGFCYLFQNPNVTDKTLLPTPTTCEIKNACLVDMIRILRC